MYCLEQHFVLSFTFFEIKAQQYFVVDQFRFVSEKLPTYPSPKRTLTAVSSSYIFLD